VAPAVESSEFLEWRPGVVTRLHSAQATGARSLCVLEQLCEPGTGAPWHRHDGVEEVILVLEGRARFQVADEEFVVEAGGSVLLPAGSRHAFANVGATTLRLIATFASAAPPVDYEAEPGVLEIGRDARRQRTPLEAARP
jgi:quercetin dioxygenase-like cupin family protein